MSRTVALLLSFCLYVSEALAAIILLVTISSYSLELADYTGVGSDIVGLRLGTVSLFSAVYDNLELLLLLLISYPSPSTGSTFIPGNYCVLRLVFYFDN